MKSKFPGECHQCHRTWNIDDDIHLVKKDGKWIGCTDKACFDSQKPDDESLEKYQTGTNTTQRNLETIMDNAETCIKRFAQICDELKVIPTSESLSTIWNTVYIQEHK